MLREPLPKICIACAYTGYDICLMHGNVGDFYVCRPCYKARPGGPRDLAQWGHSLLSRGPVLN